MTHTVPHTIQADAQFLASTNKAFQSNGSQKWETLGFLGFSLVLFWVISYCYTHIWREKAKF